MASQTNAAGVHLSLRLRRRQQGQPEQAPSCGQPWFGTAPRRWRAVLSQRSAGYRRGHATPAVPQELQCRQTGRWSTSRESETGRSMYIEHSSAGGERREGGSGRDREAAHHTPHTPKQTTHTAPSQTRLAARHPAPLPPPSTAQVRRPGAECRRGSARGVSKAQMQTQDPDAGQA